MPRFYEFFAGDGMAGAGLGSGWECLLANDFAGRHNVRDLDIIAQMTMLANGLDGKRRRYDDLVANHA